MRLPEEPQLELLRRFDVSFETAGAAGPEMLEILVRQWRADCGGGGRDLWAYDTNLDLLWHQTVDPPYGHHNAMHLVDLNADGRPEIMAGGTWDDFQCYMELKGKLLAGELG